ncbi:hypothetical protein ACFQMA_10935 [Halosimplex aquaticum]|uniref:Uncharacterized protein n=1 Tax=Halosimplex aquaticum TaxID=3026162 RepID=A0ABD5XZ62_9EURY|nr:hypothetical protein [Halosimplex aquaticum]
MSVQNSHIAQILSVGRRRLRAAFTAATTTRQARGAVERLRAVAAGSHLADGVAWSARAARSSWLYNWLTAEPDPDMVVIDLRETYVVGPILGILDRMFAVLSRGWGQAKSGELFEDIHGALLARPIQAVSVAALAAIIVGLAVTVALGSPGGRTVGFGLLAASAALAGTRIQVSWDEVTDSRTYELLVALLEPPEPPEPPEKQ